MSELIVVGVDGSADAAAALTFAATDAARRGARVRVVAVIKKPDFVTVLTTTIDFESVAQQVAKDAIDTFTADHPALAGRVEMEIVGLTGHPATELVEQSRQAAVLVLGHRGRGAFASTFLGSVGLSCVLHDRSRHPGRRGGHHTGGGRSHPGGVRCAPAGRPPWPR